MVMELVVIKIKIVDCSNSKVDGSQEGYCLDQYC